MSQPSPLPEVTSLTELRRFHRPVTLPPWHQVIVQHELNGGRTSERELDVLAANPQVTTLTISGLDQGVFEALIERFGLRLSALHLWKCPRLSDLSPLEDALTFPLKHHKQPHTSLMP